jgi:hypothetical protein
MFSWVIFLAWLRLFFSWNTILRVAFFLQCPAHFTVKVSQIISVCESVKDFILIVYTVSFCYLPSVNCIGLVPKIFIKVSFSDYNFIAPII